MELDDSREIANAEAPKPLKGLLKPNPKAVRVNDEPGPVAGPQPAYSKDDIISEAAVLDWLGVTRQWLADHRTRVEPIIPHLPLGKTVRYSRAEIQIWLRHLAETRPRWNRQTSAA